MTEKRLPSLFDCRIHGKRRGLHLGCEPPCPKVGVHFSARSLDGPRVHGRLLASPRCVARATHPLPPDLATLRPRAALLRAIPHYVGLLPPPRYLLLRFMASLRRAIAGATASCYGLRCGLLFARARARGCGLRVVHEGVVPGLTMEAQAPETPPSEADQNAVMTGTAVLSVPPVPSCPFEFHPQHRTV